MVDYTLYTTREGRAEGESADAHRVRARGISARAWFLYYLETPDHGAIAASVISYCAWCTTLGAAQ